MMTYNETLKCAVGATEMVLSILLDRSGFVWWWDSVDPDIQTEIKSAMSDLIAKAIWEARMPKVDR